ncbi:hypothetical protein Tco_0717017 [Tanacetum coccineum]
MKLFKISTSRRKGLDKENVSKQGRKSDKTKPMFNDSDFDVLDDAMENVKGGSIVEQITTAEHTLNTASINVSAAGPSTSTTGDIFEDEMTTIVDTLVAIRSTRPMTISVMIRNVKEEPGRATPVPTISKQVQDVQARMDADELLAKRLQQEEREQITIDKQARTLVDLIAERKKLFAAQRAEQVRNKPPTRAQLGNKMVTYLKHIGNYTHTQLKSKSFEEIQKLYKKEQKWINDFVPLNSEMVKDNGKEDGDSQKQAKSSKKRLRAEHDEESVKKQKLEDEAETEELKACLDIVPRNDIAMDFESLATKYPIIDWKTYILTENVTTGKESYFVMDTGIAIHIMVENTYPLTQEMLSRMLNRRLEVDHESEMHFELLGFKIKTRSRRVFGYILPSDQDACGKLKKLE